MTPSTFYSLKNSRKPFFYCTCTVYTQGRNVAVELSVIITTDTHSAFQQVILLSSVQL